MGRNDRSSTTFVKPCAKSIFAFFIMLLLKAEPNRPENMLRMEKETCARKSTQVPVLRDG